MSVTPVSGIMQHFNNTKVLLGNKSGVNFCYNVPHTVDSAHHQFDQFVETVDPTCTKAGLYRVQVRLLY